MLSLFRFIFDLLDHAALGDQALDQFEFESMQPSLNAFMGKDNHKGLGATVVTSSKSKSTKNDSDRGIKEGDTKRIKKVTPNKSGGGGFGGPK